MGVFEMEPFAGGTKRVAQAMAETDRLYGHRRRRFSCGC